VIEDSMKGGLMALSWEGRIDRVNHALCELTGFKPEQLRGALPPYPFWPPEQHDLHSSALHDLMQGEHLEHGVELPFLCADGRRIDVRFYVTPLVAPDGGVQHGWLATLYDITELKRQRLELKATHERFLAVLNGLHAGVCVTGCADGTLLYANPAFEELWQASPAQPYCATLPREHDNKPMALEFSPDGGRRWFELDRRIISWVDGNEVWLDILADVTITREREARERAREERFQTTSRLIAMGEMASSLAHELNQPLTAIRTYSSGLVRRLPPDSELDPAVISAINAISEQAKRAAQIIASIRAFIKKHEPQLELSDPAKVVNRAIHLAEPMTQKQGVRLKFEFDPHPCELQIDPVLIEQVVLNLIKNAVEALVEAKTSQPRILIRTHRGLAYWRLEVADNGPGLSENMQANLFTPFYSTKPEGMGIGLNICRSIIEHHRGEFGVACALAQGCVFWFTLPLLEAEKNKTTPEGVVGPVPSS
jgi:PAS domain S-box-containing protein